MRAGQDLGGGNGDPLIQASPVAQTVKHLPAVQETWVQPQGQEDLLEKEMATPSRVLARRTPWTEEPGRLQSMGRKELDMTERLHFPFLLFRPPVGTLKLPAHSVLRTTTTTNNNPRDRATSFHLSRLGRNERHRAPCKEYTL